jgi:hypothetical protein
MLAILRTGAWEWALFFHVLGALLLVGSVLMVSVAAVASLRSQTAEPAVALRRVGFRTLAFVVVPSYLLTRLTAEWVRSEDAFPDDMAWIDIGYIVTDSGLILLVALLVLGWFSLRQVRGGASARTVLARAYAVVAPLYLVALLVAVWAMTAKPD